MSRRFLGVLLGQTQFLDGNHQRVNNFSDLCGRKVGNPVIDPKAFLHTQEGETIGIKFRLKQFLDLP